QKAAQSRGQSPPLLRFRTGLEKAFAVVAPAGPRLSAELLRRRASVQVRASPHHAPDGDKGIRTMARRPGTGAAKVLDAAGQNLAPPGRSRNRIRRPALFRALGV